MMMEATATLAAAATFLTHRAAAAQATPTFHQPTPEAEAAGTPVGAVTVEAEVMAAAEVAMVEAAADITNRETRRAAIVQPPLAL